MKNYQVNPISSASASIDMVAGFVPRMLRCFHLFSSRGSAAKASALPRQFLVLHPVRDDGILAEPPHLVLFVILEVAFEPFDMAVAFESQHVGGDTVEE